MDTLAEKKEPQSIAIREVEKFVTKIWEHPLVDQQTRDYRAKGIPAIEKLIMSVGIELADFIAIPYGSVRWSVKSPDEAKSTKEPSDFDAFLIFRNEETEKLARRTYGKLLFGNCRFSFGGDRTLAEVETHKDLSPYSPGNVTQLEVNLLLTPDNYIAGNVDLARQLRVNAIKSFKDDFYLKFFFERDFKKWADASPPHDSGHVRDIAKSKDDWPYLKVRRQRLSRRLLKRSEYSKDPEAYIRGFLKVYEAIQLPSITAFREAILSSGGRLSIDPRYSARGIGY